MKKLMGANLGSLALVAEVDESTGVVTFSGSPTGTHRLAVDVSPERVSAHWSGYVAAARAATQSKKSAVLPSSCLVVSKGGVS